MEQHIPVALDRCIALLASPIEESIKAKGEAIFVDATLGLGGHSFALAQRFPHLRIIGIDRDQTAIMIAKDRLSRFSDRIHFAHGLFDTITALLSDLGIQEVDGILFDLGVSSMQLDNPERGFSYSTNAPLDMRMDQSGGITAQDILNTYDRDELIRVLRSYGEERFAARIVGHILEARDKGALTTTEELSELIKRGVPAPARRTGGNPAKRTFQALRIEVNKELAVLERALPQALYSIRVGGRVVVMSYQSLEDKIVKRQFESMTASQTPRGLPVEIPGTAAKFELVFRGSEGASDEEIASNPRASSMRLRAIQKVAA
jgi:16S rRNA (cytosine1402-N4)-methyltransferase